MSSGRIFAGERVVVCAMRGWSDAGDAASDAVAELQRALGLDRVVAKIDDEQYFDYSTTRPRISLANGERRVEWPHVALYGPQVGDDHGIYVLLGDEPALNWKSFVDELLDACAMEGITSILIVGSLLADTPHTRDIPVSDTSDDEELRMQYAFEPSKYQGPMGILSVFAEAAMREGGRVGSLWASVPHYAQAPDLPATKAALALLEELSDLLLFNFDRDRLREAAAAWEHRVTQAVQHDEDLSQYVEYLEQTRDVVDSEAATGDAIAAEFEAFLSTDADDRDNPFEINDPGADDGPDEADKPGRS